MKLATAVKARLHPTMSVVVCASGDRYAARVRRCFDSVRRQVGVRHQDIEIILMVAHRPMDAEGSKQLEQVAEVYHAKVVREAYEAPGYNYSFARNTATKHCTGAVLCFLDADVILDQVTFEQMFEHLDVNTCVLVRCSSMKEDGEDDSYQASDSAKFKEVVQQQAVMPDGDGGCIFGPRVLFDSIRGWDEGYVGYGGPDQDLCWRVREAGYKFVNLTDLTGLLALHQWHPSRAQDEPAMRFINKKRFAATREGKLGPRRNPQGYGGVIDAVSILVAHHPLRPASVLKSVLVHIGKATHLPVTVDLYVQGPCSLPNFGNLDFEVNVIQKEKNMGMAAPRAASIDNMLQRKHAYWGMVDDNALISANSINAMIEVFNFERDVGQYDVGCIQLANNRQAKRLPVGIRLSRETENGLPILEWDRCAIAIRQHEEHSWAIGDVVGSGHSLYRREVFERGVYPDPRYFIGFVDYDMCFQMHTRGILCALLRTSRAEKIKKDCYPSEYNSVRRDKKVLWQSAGKLASKWGVVLKGLG